MALVLVMATVADALIAVALVGLVRRTERLRAAMHAEHRGMLARLRGEIGDLVADAEGRTRALDEALATREATLRVLLQIAAAAETAPARPSPDPAGVRLLRELELTLEPREPATDARS